MGLSTLIKQLYLQTIGGSAPSGAASSSGDISQMVKYLIANPPGLAAKRVGLTTQAQGFSGTSAFGAQQGPAASGQTSLAGAGAVQVGQAAFHPDGTFVAHALFASPFFKVWNFSSSGYGSVLSNPASLPGITGGVGVAFHPNGNWVACCGGGTPFLNVYAFDKVGASIGAKSSNPATLPAGTCMSVNFSPDGNYLAVAMEATPFIHVYAFDSATGAIGAKVTNPATLPAGNGRMVAWSRNGQYIAITHATSPFVSVYPWSAGAFGAKLTDPGTTPGTDGLSCDWLNDDVLFVTSATSPFIYAYPITPTAVGTKWANPASLPPGTCNQVAVSPQGNYVAMASSTTPFVKAYPISGLAFGAALSNPGTLPAGAVYQLAIRPTKGANLVIGMNNAASSQYSYPMTYPGTFWTPPGITSVQAIDVMITTAAIRAQVKVGGVWLASSVIDSGFIARFPMAVQELFVGPDLDSGTGKVNVVAFGN